MLFIWLNSGALFFYLFKIISKEADGCDKTIKVKYPRRLNLQRGLLGGGQLELWKMVLVGTQWMKLFKSILSAN